MPFFSLPLRPIAFVTAGAFGLGVLTAHGAHAIDTHVAVSQAQAAAADLAQAQADFAQTLTDAQSTAEEAQEIAHEAAVTTAAAELDAALADAAQLAEDARVPIDDATATVTDKLDANAKVEQSLDPTSVDIASSIELLSDEVAPGLNENTTSELTPTETGTTASDSEAEDPTASETTVLDSGSTPTAVVDDPVVAKVLHGEASASDARAATAALQEATAALATATEGVEVSAEALTDVVEDTERAATVLALTHDVPAAHAVATEQRALLADVGDRITDGATVAKARTALAALQSAALNAANVDRQDAGQVAQVADALVQATTAVSEAMDDVRVSHTAWVDDANATISQENEQATAKYETALAEARAEQAALYEDAVSTYDNGWEGQPTGVSGTNGRLSSSQLCEVDFAPGHRLQCEAAEAIEAADAAYFAETGRHLVMTDSYRSYGLQVTTRARKPSTAAVPGTSNHGWGMAVDLDVASAAWLAENGAEFGWVHPRWARPGGSKPESWHLEFVGVGVETVATPTKPVLAEPVENAFEVAEDAEETEER